MLSPLETGTARGRAGQPALQAGFWHWWWPRDAGWPRNRQSVQRGREAPPSHTRRGLVALNELWPFPYRPSHSRGRVLLARGQPRTPGIADLQEITGYFCVYVPGADREFGSGNGQHVGQDREPHAAPGACLGVEVVVALQRRADHP